jgi:hypothetical protein
VVFQDGSCLERIGIRAFHQCSFKEIVLPALVTHIEEEAFYLCGDLTNIHLVGSRLTSIGQAAFMTCGCNVVTIPRTLSNLQADAFKGCPSLISVLFNSPCSLPLISPKTFQGCPKLERITIPLSVQIIAEDAFAGCSGLTQIVFPRGGSLHELGDRAFAYCGVRLVEISTRIIRFGIRVFYKCKYLSDVRLLDVESIGADSFADCPLTTLHLPKALAPNGGEVTGRQTFANFIAANPTLADVFSVGDRMHGMIDVRWL